MRIYLLGIIWGIIVFPNLLVAQNSQVECLENIQSWVFKKRGLIEITNRLPPGEYLDHESLRRIIYPEYIAYNENSNSFECSFIKLLYTVGSDRFSTISIGPFQMQLKFIKTLINNVPPTAQTVELYKHTQNGTYSAMVDQLDYLSKIEIQWEILLLYERYAMSLGLLTSKKNIDKAINYYNSGKIVLTNINFSKLECAAKSYLVWSLFFSEL